MSRHFLPAVFALSILTPSLPAAEVKLGPEVVLSPSSHAGEGQVDVQIARSPTGVFSVWSDPFRYEVLASFNGIPMTIDETETDDWIGWPAVAVSDDVFLVVWRHDTMKEMDRVLARRFNFIGHPIDAEPIVLQVSDRTFSQLRQTPPSIVFDGSNFFVAWARGYNQSNSKPGSLHTIRIGEEGSPFDARETPVAFGFGQGPRSVRALWTGAEFFAAYTLEITGHAAGIYHDRHIAMVRFDRTNTVISQTPASFLFNSANLSSIAVAATVVDSRVSLAWVNDTNGISAAQTTFDGKTLTGPRVIVPRSPDSPGSIAEILWNGSEHVLIWADTKLRAMRLDADLNPLDAAPFDVFSDPSPPSAAWLIRTPGGVAIAYSRSDSANGGALRAFMRTLDRIPKPVHRRAVGR